MGGGADGRGLSRDRGLEGGDGTFQVQSARPRLACRGGKRSQEKGPGAPQPRQEAGKWYSSVRGGNTVPQGRGRVGRGRAVPIHTARENPTLLSVSRVPEWSQVREPEC